VNRPTSPGISKSAEAGSGTATEILAVVSVANAEISEVVQQLEPVSTTILG
jgi:hypothetical protein